VKQVGNTILAKGVNHILAKRDNSAWPKGAKLSGFSTIRQHEWGKMKKSQPTHDHESALPYTIMMQIYYLLLK